MNWQPIETAPEGEAEYFVLSNLAGMLVCSVWDASRFNDDASEDDDDRFDVVYLELGMGGGEIFGDLQITHWAPFPDGPLIITDLAN